jgi:predicted metal-dependent peptidase
VFEPWEELTLPPSIAGGGGTDFRPPFRWIEEQDLHPGVVVYFTDARGVFPAEPACPVVWLVKGHAPVPWGNRIQLN